MVSDPVGTREKTGVVEEAEITTGAEEEISGVNDD